LISNNLDIKLEVILCNTRNYYKGGREARIAR
jgi:hypothetical protein